RRSRRARLGGRPTRGRVAGAEPLAPGRRAAGRRADDVLKERPTDPMPRQLVTLVERGQPRRDARPELVFVHGIVVVEARNVRDHRRGDGIELGALDVGPLEAPNPEGPDASRAKHLAIEAAHAAPPAVLAHEGAKSAIDLCSSSSVRTRRAHSSASMCLSMQSVISLRRMFGGIASSSTVFVPKRAMYFLARESLRFTSSGRRP